MNNRSRGRRLLAVVTVIMPVSVAAAADTVLVPLGSMWKYLDDGTDPGSLWMRISTGPYDNWPEAPAELGYGDGDEATVIGFGGDPDNKHLTTFFRYRFVLDAAERVRLRTGSARIRMKVDDGAVVYFNGVEVYRYNTRGKHHRYDVTAIVEVDEPDESGYIEFPVDISRIRAGNVVAVAVHQSSVTDPDHSFDLEMIASDAPPGPAVTRGPYLQLGTPTSMIVRWRTSLPSDSRVLVGDAPNNLTWEVTDSAMTTEHEIQLSGLDPDTTYYYAIGTTTLVLRSGEVSQFFVTPPPIGTRKPTRVWLIGDSGTASDPGEDPMNPASVRDAYYDLVANETPDLWLMLGDNAYSDGTDAEYQDAVFDLYSSMLRRSVLWPTIGNHDARSITDMVNQTGVYFDIFSLPKNAESGGMASGTEAFYSFDYANVHFICLNSERNGATTPGSPMMTWLEADLAATLQDWIVAYWHQPPYSKGSHDSDRTGRMIEMRELVVPVLEDGGVDLVFTGHSHDYERSYLIDGHYGFSEEFGPSMVLDGGDGREDGDGAYAKPTLGAAGHEGAVYTVCGCSGKDGGGTHSHPAMWTSQFPQIYHNRLLGSMVLDFNLNRLDAKFIENDGTVLDHFTILKGSCDPPVVTPSVDVPVLTGRNHRFVDVGWTLNVSGDCDFGDPSDPSIEVWSDEAALPDNGNGPGVSDAEIVDGKVLLRGERLGTEDGRVYLIIVRVENPAGAAVACSSVVVPHNQSAAALSDVSDQADAAVRYCSDNDGTPPPDFVQVGSNTPGSAPASLRAGRSERGRRVVAPK
jgi:hypothetical protein